MPETSKEDELIEYPMRWPERLRDRVFAAEARRARARAQRPSVAAWMREAAMEKLERDGEEGS